MRSTIFSDSPSLFIGSWCALQGLLWQNLRRSCDSSTRFLLPRVLLLRICTRSFMIEKRGHTLWSLYSECCWLLIEFWDSRGSAHARGCMCACVCVCVCVCWGLFVCLLVTRQTYDLPSTGLLHDILALELFPIPSPVGTVTPRLRGARRSRGVGPSALTVLAGTMWSHVSRGGRGETC